MFNGRHDVYYLRKHLESKANLVSTMSADLSEDALMETIELVEKAPNTSSSSMQNEKCSDIVDAICKMHTSHMQVELTNRKLEILQNQRPRR